METQEPRQKQEENKGDRNLIDKEEEKRCGKPKKGNKINKGRKTTVRISLSNNKDEKPKKTKKKKNKNKDSKTKKKAMSFLSE